jgi:AbrB family looped-hinge helix DNA binding protein
MHKPPTVKVSKRHQIVLPSFARNQLNIEAGDRLLVDTQDGILVLIPQPERYTERLAGLHRDIWSSVAADDYLQQEREAWKNSDSG